MELVELLDKIGATAPRDCQTCRHMATHKKCDGCLYGPERTWEQRNEPYEYRNWEPGNWLRDLQHAERTGVQNIVIGGQGEAEVNTKSTPQETAKELHRVAECCGYYVGNLHRFNEDKNFRIYVHNCEGSWAVVWDILADGSTRLAYIWKTNSGTDELLEGRRYWPHYENGWEV